jgi:phage terminase small subunit
MDVAATRMLWEDILGCAPVGVLREIDAELFAAYMVATETFIAACRQQSTRPLIDPEGTVSPLVRLQRQSAETMNCLGAQLGFDPTSRTRFAVPEVKDDDDDQIWGRAAPPSEAAVVSAPTL